MNTGNPADDRDYEIPCHILDVWEIDAAAHLTPEDRARIPIGEFVRDEILLPA